MCRDGKRRVARYKCGRCNQPAERKPKPAKAAKPPIYQAIPGRRAVADPVGEEILSLILDTLGLRLEYLSSEHRSPIAVRARDAVVCLLRSCRHPSTPALTYKRIGVLVGLDASTVSDRIKSGAARGPIEPWPWPRVPKVAPELWEGLYGR